MSTLALRVAGIFGRSFSSILSVAYTSSRVSAPTFTLSKAIVSKSSVIWPVAWLIEFTRLPWSSWVLYGVVSRTGSCPVSCTGSCPVTFAFVVCHQYPSRFSVGIHFPSDPIDRKNGICCLSLDNGRSCCDGVHNFYNSVDHHDVYSRHVAANFFLCDLHG